MAGAAGVDPWSYTFGEIFHLLEGKRAETWDYIGWVCFMMPAFGKKSKKLEKYNPYLMNKKEAERASLHSGFRDAADAVDLPAELSENEKNQVFERMKAKWEK